MNMTSTSAPVPAPRRPRRSRRSDTALGWALHGAIVAGAAGAVAIDRRLRGRGGTAERAATLVVPVLTAGFYGVLWAIETRRPFREEWQPEPGEVRTDAAFLGSVMATQLAAMTVVAPVSRRITRTLGVDRLPVPVGVAAAVLTFDLGHSRLHHLGHRWGPAWRIHSVHHSPERLYWFNATRFQFIEMFVDMAMETVAMSVLGLSRDQHVAYQAVRGFYGQFQHCNIELRSGALDHVFSTPDLHRWHHSTVYEEGDTNYGAVTSVWDKVFGTFFRPVDRDGPDQVGVGRMPEFPQSFGALERVPVDWAAIRDANAATWFDGDPHDAPDPRRAEHDVPAAVG